MKPATAPTVDASYIGLKVTYLALRRFNRSMEARYGDRRLKETDTLRYLGQIELSMSDADRQERTRLSKARAEATERASLETIDRVIEEGESL